MTAIAITATGTDVGKTFVACGLITALRAQGRAVDAFKPVLSGFSVAEGSDAGLLLAALGRPLSEIERMSPLRFAAPLAPPSAARAEGWRQGFLTRNARKPRFLLRSNLGCGAASRHLTIE